MSNLSPTKRSFARGIGQALQQMGQTKFASTEELRLASDKCAELILTEPIQQDGEGQLFQFTPTPEEMAKTAQQLIGMSDYVAKQGYKVASDPASISLDSPQERFGDLIVEAQRKLAAEGGATVGMTGEREKNQDANTSAATVEGKQEIGKRPKNYANVGQGNTNFSEPAANRVGQEQPHPGQEGNVDGASSNSVVDATKTSGIRDILSKIAMGTGSAVTSSDPNLQNTQVNSPQAETVQDQQLRPEETYANVGQGNANINEPPPVHVGVEVNHPLVETGVQGAGSNSVTEASKAAAYMQDVASKLMPILPATMGSAEKIACVETFCDTNPALKEAYLRDVFAKHNTPFPG